MELIVLGKLLWLLIAYLLGLVGGVFLHELGHALAVLTVTKQSALLQIGRDERSEAVTIGRISLLCSWRGLRYGFTRYDREAEPIRKQIFVAACGPLASLFFSLTFLLAFAASEGGSWSWFGFLGLFVANLRILVTSLWPRPYHPDGSEGEAWLSDGLDIWHMWRGKGKGD